MRQHPVFDRMQDRFAHNLECVGELWNLLVLREAFIGTTRFEDFRTGTGISTATLTRRLKALVDNGFLERHRYCARPPRDEYRLTPRGKELYPVLVALMAWSDRETAGDQGSAAVPSQSKPRAH